MEPKISVIIPIYNVENYLEKCIESVINQTYKNLEIILVNDGSTDGCKEICDRYKASDKRIKVIHKKNGGISDARNWGIDNATGDYIAFLDSDDWIDLGLYENLYNNIIKEKCDISMCNYKRTYDNKSNLKHSDKKVIYTNHEILKELYTDKQILIVVVWNKLFKKELFNSFRFPVGKIHEDEYLIPSVLYKANKIVYLEKELIYYRITPNSIMNSKFNENRLFYLDILDMRNTFYEDNKLWKLRKLNSYCQIDVLMDYYFRIKRIESNNKNKLLFKIKIYLLNVIKKSNKYINKKDILRIIIFIFSPTFYKNIIKSSS